jgi:very-short-patch-repair endonuclease
LSALAASQQGGRQLKKLLAEVKKKRRQPTLRSLSEDFWEHGLSQALPVWLCSPESAASLFPPTAGLFDLVIFDEASQCPVEAAIPALVRARRAIVAGDDQQMPPSHFFQASAREDEDDEDDSVVLASQSVLDLCRAAWPHLTLAWHYRSRDERLIAFSNAAFYGGKLTTAPRVGTAVDDDAASDGLHFTRVSGCWHQQQNHVEASAVVDLMVSLLCQPSPQSIGVVAFNQKQSELIETLVQQRLDVDEGFRRAWHSDGLRPTVEQSFIRNLENVQGDERDVIIVSPAYGPNERGVLHARFGPLGQQGGDKRLNVAITRARRGLHVLCSFNPADLDVEQATWPGPRLFKAWLQAVQAAASGDDDGLDRALTLAARLGGGHGVVDVVGGGSGASASPAIGGIVIEQLASALVARGCRVQRALGLGRQRLDLAVGVVGGPLTVGVDVSGFLSEHDALARDVYTPAFWARAGWRVLRVTPRAWATDAEQVIAAVIAAVQGR